MLASGTYRVSFKMKLVSGSTSNMFATCSSASNGSYQDVTHEIVPNSTWQTFTLDYTLKLIYRKVSFSKFIVFIMME